MMTVLVLPYKKASESAKSLSVSLNCKRMKLENSSIRDKEGLTIINWGNSTKDLSHLPSAKVINKQDSVRLASNKLDFFSKIEEENKDAFVSVNIPDWTTDPEVAKDWYTEGHDVVIRNTLQGHSGEGIDLIRYNLNDNANDVIYDAPLYTKYMKKRDEFRIHVMGGVPILVQRKGIRTSESPSTYQIRNTANGFIYLISDVEPDSSVISQAINAVNVLGLDFGAVDVIWNEHKKLATVLEINTACGLKGDTTITRYKNGFEKLLKNESIPKWDTPIRLSSPREILENKFARYSYYEMDIHEGDTVDITRALEDIFINFCSIGGNDAGINHWMNAEHQGYGGYFYIHSINHRRSIAQIAFTDETEDTCLVDFHIPLVLLEDIEA
jgi:hypothetical protein